MVVPNSPQYRVATTAHFARLLKKLAAKHLKKAARKTDAKKLAALRARERGLLRELK